MLSRLRDLENSQMETTVLWSYLALPKVAYVLRTCPPSLIPKALGSFDSLMVDTLCNLVGGPPPDWSWLKASLPSSLGGLSIQRASLHAPAAYIGSYQQCRSIMSSILGHADHQPVHLSAAITSLAAAASRSDLESINDIDVPVTQHSLSRAIDKASFDVLLASAPNTQSKAFALSSAIQHAGDWLNVIPSLALSLHLQDQEFLFSLMYWLGLQMFQERLQCPVCLVEADPFGDHQVGCGGNCD